jgi:hypothetical protein
VIEAPVSHAEAIRRMKAAGVLVVILNAREAWAGTITGKVFEYLAVRRPILLVGPRGAASDLIEQSGAGVVGDPRDAAALEASIEKVAALAIDPEFTGASDEVLARYDRRHQAEAWSGILGPISAQR